MTGTCRLPLLYTGGCANPPLMVPLMPGPLTDPPVTGSLISTPPGIVMGGYALPRTRLALKMGWMENGSGFVTAMRISVGLVARAPASRDVVSRVGLEKCIFFGKRVEGRWSDWKDGERK